jgi:hypothetical protein
VILIGVVLVSTAAGVDSKVCGACHSAIYRSYLKTPMARTSGFADPSTAPLSGRTEVVDAASTVRLRVTLEKNATWVHFAQGATEGARRLDYFLGAGVLGRSYASNLDGFLFQAPVSYYTSTRDWDLSPGFEDSAHLPLARPVERGCLNCHASGLRPIAETVNQYQNPAFAEPGVSCERCHGPGDDHVARIKSGDTRRGLGIVNPARLNPAERDSVCGQCHLVGAIRILKSNANRYEPGKRLFDSTAAFLWSGGDYERTSNSHFEQLVNSACWKKSAGMLWCGSCHSIHTVLTEADRRESYRKRCLACHTADAVRCSAPLAQRTSVRDDCIACHMPTKPITTVAHAVQVDHTIARVPAESSLANSTGEASLVPFPDSTAGDRELGLAYATEALPRNNRVWGERAFQLLRKVAAAQPEDAAVALQLAQLYDRMGQQQQACDYFRQAVEKRAPGTAALVNLGACQASQGDLDGAAKSWSQALQRNPAVEAARLNLAIAQSRLGDVEGARATLQKALEYDPFSQRVRELLQSIKR